MKYITIPQTPINITDITGNPVMRDEKTQLSVSFAQFIRDRIIDKKFSEGKGGADAALLAFETKCALDDQTCETGQVIAFENDQYKAILASTNEPDGGYNTVLQHNLVTFIKAIRDARDSK